MRYHYPIQNTQQPISVLANEVLIRLVNDKAFPAGYVLAKSYPLKRIQATEYGTMVELPLAFFVNGDELSGEATIDLFDDKAEVKVRCAGRHLLSCQVLFEQPQLDAC